MVMPGDNKPDVADHPWMLEKGLGGLRSAAADRRAGFKSLMSDSNAVHHCLELRSETATIATKNKKRTERPNSKFPNLQPIPF